MDEDELQANECEEWGDLLAELRWFKRVTEDDDKNVYGRAIDRIEKLEAAGQAILDRMSGTLSNGKGVEATDGEKCWIVHSDEIEALSATITSSAR